MKMQWAITTLLIASVVAMVAYSSTRQSETQIFETGLAAATSNDLETLADCAARLKNSSQFKPHANLLHGFELQARGQLKHALVVFSAANEHPETREEAYYQAGTICYQLKHYGDCIRLFLQVLKWNPDRIEAHQMLAASYYDIGAMEQAINSLNHVIQRKPQDYRPHYMQATILQDFERFADAEIAYKHAASLVPSGTTVGDEILAGWGDCLVRLRRFEDALEAMQSARPWPDVLARRAQANFNLRRFDEARQLAEQTLLASPLHPNAVLVAAQVYEQSGELDRSIKLLDETLQKHPNNLLLHHRMADVLGAAGRPDEAISHRNKADEIAERRAAFSAAHQAAIHDVTNAELRLKLGEIAVTLGEISLARNWYQAALGMSPENPQIRQQWQQFQSTHPQESSDWPAAGPPTAAAAPAYGVQSPSDF